MKLKVFNFLQISHGIKMLLFYFFFYMLLAGFLSFIIDVFLPNDLEVEIYNKLRFAIS